MSKDGKMSLKDLPPRVIVYDILPFQCVGIGRGTPEFELYGYFKLDRFRHLFFLFPCINYVIYDNTVVQICAEKLIFIFFTINESSLPLVHLMIERAEKMKNLQRMECNICPNDTSDLPGLLFSKQHAFPSLRKLSIRRAPGDGFFTINPEKQQQPMPGQGIKQFSKWENAVSMWKNLEVLEMRVTGVFPGQVLKNEGFLQKLKRLELSWVYVEMELILELASLETLILRETKNVVIKPGPNFLVLELEFVEHSIGSGDMRYLLTRNGHDCVEMESVYIQSICEDCGVQNFDELLFLQNIERKVKSWKLDSITGIRPPFHFQPSVECIKLEYLPEFDDNTILNSITPNLKTLITQAPISSSRKWKYFSNLKKLDFHLSSRSSQDFFQVNEFQNLQTLDLAIRYISTDRYWSRMPNLRSIELRCMQLSIFKKSCKIFPEEGFPILENFTVSQYYGGESFNIDDDDIQILPRLKSKNIKNIILGGPGFRDECFHSLELGNSLQNLVIKKNGSITGSSNPKWSENMRSLKNLRLKNVKNVQDEIFISTSFPNLVTMILTHLPSLEGPSAWNWKSFSNLTNMKIKNLPSLENGAFQGSGCELSSLMSFEIKNCNKLTGTGWTIKFPNLEEFKYQGSDTISVLWMEEEEQEKIAKDKFDVDKFVMEHLEMTHSIKNLSIHGCKGFTGEIKAPDGLFPKLTNLTVSYCKNIGDHLFAQNSFPVLKRLTVQVLEGKEKLEKVNVKGTGWNYMPKLEFVNISSLKLGESFFQNKPFPESCFMSYKAFF